MSTTIRHLELAALLVPFIGLTLLVILATFGVAWQANNRFKCARCNRPRARYSSRCTKHGRRI
jgi:hypothetical protein